MIDRVKRKRTIRETEDIPEVPEDALELSEDDEELLQELEKGLSIDPHALDDALTTQSVIYYEVSQRLALLTSRRDAAKLSMADTEAYTDGIIRRAAREQDSKKTAEEIRALVRVNGAVQKAQRVYLTLNYGVGQFRALQEAFQQRSYALNKLVELYLSSYFADAPVNAGVSSIRDRDADQAKSTASSQRRNLREQEHPDGE